MDTDQGKIEDSFGDKVTVAHCVEAVVKRLSETKISSIAHRIDRQR